jgi:S-(hydroxymethyl)glutathione dehydrogenase / alcohol dehydrogenase
MPNSVNFESYISRKVTLRAAVLYKAGEPLRIERLQVPALKEGQVLVKISYSGICHSQLMEVKGLRGADPYLPHLLGHEAVGVVEDTGPGVSKVKAGDRVVLGWIKGRGLNAMGAQFKNEAGVVINSGGVTTFSDKTIASENRLVKVPDSIPDEIAVLFGCAVPTGAGIVMNELPAGRGGSIAIFGLGGIGINALLAARVRGDMSPLIAIDVEPRKLELAKEFGADHVIDASKVDPVQAVREITKGGVDFCVEAAGLTTTIEQAFAMLQPQRGQLVFASHPKHGSKISLDPFELICGKRLWGSWGGKCCPDDDLPKFFDIFSSGKWPLRRLLSDPYPLEKVNEALQDLDQRRITRALLKM